MVLIAANAGNTTNDTVTTTNYVAAGVWYTDHDAIPADAATIITNVSTVIAPIEALPGMSRLMTLFRTTPCSTPLSSPTPPEPKFCA